MLGYARAWLALRFGRRGVTPLEYGLIASLIAMAIITALTAVGTNLLVVFHGIAVTLPS